MNLIDILKYKFRKRFNKFIYRFFNLKFNYGNLFKKVYLFIINYHTLILIYHIYMGNRC